MNIAGLAIGIAFCILAFLFIRYEWSFDRFHRNQNQISRVEGAIPAPLGKTIAGQIPGIEKTVRFKKMHAVFIAGVNAFNEEILLTDSTFFQVFTFQLLQGDKNQLFQDKFSLVISQKMADKYFSKANP